MQLSVTRCLSLDAALTTGGRIVSLKDTLTGTVTGYTVYHHVTDHLGSVRAVVYAGGTAPSAQQGISPGTVEETSDYLPFGTRWSRTGGSITAPVTQIARVLSRSHWATGAGRRGERVWKTLSL